MLQVNFNDSMFTYQTRLNITEEQESILSQCANLLSVVERSLFKDLSRGMKASDLKSSYLLRFGITARHFNAIRIQLEGKISSIEELQKDHLKEIRGRIVLLKEAIEKCSSRKAFTLHQKKRKLASLESKCASLEENLSLGKIQLCFGSRSLFRAQFDLTANGYSSHHEWLQDWQSKRSSSFYLLGSKDETAGNQTCSATLQEDGSISLRLRLPDALSNDSKYLTLKNVRFSYGHEAIVHAVHRNLAKKLSENSSGVAISYRFKKDLKGWRVFVSLSRSKPAPITCEGIGVIGIDINCDHLAIVETDRHGNPLQQKRLALNLNGKTQNQIKALIGNAAKEIISWSLRTRKPIALEKLDFQTKKTELSSLKNAKYARMLSSFAYKAILLQIKSRAWRYGVYVTEVNPAYTSIIGRVKFAKRYGLSIHASAALTIARRFCKFSERLPRHPELVPDGKGAHVTLPLPERNRGKHVWALWRQVRKKLSVVLAAHFRAMRNRSLRQVEKHVICDSSRVLPVELQHANRQQNCSVGVSIPLHVP